MSEEVVKTQEEAVETAETAAAPTESMKDYQAELEVSYKKGPPTEDPVWDKFETMLEEKTVFPVTIESVVKAGVVTYVDEVRAFIPASKLAAGYVENLEDYKGKTIDVMVITADKENKKLVLSGKEVARKKQREERAAALAACQVGTVMEGTVDTLKDYGAFIEFENGLSGLLHVSQISTRRVEKPSDVLQEGQKVQVKIIAIKDGKISLSMRALQEGGERRDRGDRGDRREGGRGSRSNREEKDTYTYRETGTATTSLKDLLKDIDLG